MFLHKTFKALNGPFCADVPLRNYSLTHLPVKTEVTVLKHAKQHCFGETFASNVVV